VETAQHDANFDTTQARSDKTGGFMKPKQSQLMLTRSQNRSLQDLCHLFNPNRMGPMESMLCSQTDKEGESNKNSIFIPDYWQESSELTVIKMLTRQKTDSERQR
jgi:hypothetical protein